MIFCIHLKWLIKGEGHLERASALRNLFTVSLNSQRCNGVTTNSQVQKRLESLLEKHGKFGKSQQGGGFIGATAPLWLPPAVKGVKKILH